MSTVAHKSRQPEYVAMQGYKKILWEAKLKRSGKPPYTPDDEAFKIPAISDALEGDRYSIAKIGSLTIDFAITTEFLDYLGGLTDPKTLELWVNCYPIFNELYKYPVWYGRLQNLPEGEDVYVGDKLRMTFVQNPYWWGDGDDLKDDNTSTWYRDKHGTDTVLPACFKEADVSAPNSVEAPSLRGSSYFWSGIERPIKYLADESQSYDETCQCRAVCWDSSREKFYFGVHDTAGSETLPFLISYDPDTRIWEKVTEFKYTGSIKELQPNTEWEVQYLEYNSSADKVFFVCQTNHTNLLDLKAHYKIRGEIDMTSVPSTVSLTDANAFILNDKGIKIKSKSVSFQNEHPKGVSGVDYYLDIDSETIGWGTPVHGVKECGPVFYVTNIEGSLYSPYPFFQKYRTFALTKDGNKANHPRLGHYVVLEDTTNEHVQRFGLITEIRERAGYFWVTVEDASRYTWLPANTTVYIIDPVECPEPNIFIAEPQVAKVEYLYSDGLASQDPEDILVEARQHRIGRDQFYWPDKLGTVSNTGDFDIDRVGYASFISTRTAEQYYSSGSPIDTYKYDSGPVAPFTITLKGYDSSQGFLLADDFWIDNLHQDHDDDETEGHSTCSRQAGPCRVIYNGNVAKLGLGEFKTYGDIYLFKSGATILAAWNDHKQDSQGDWFATCNLAKWTGSKFVKLWSDRTASNWRSKPECYLKSAIKYRGDFYFGVRYYEHNWVDTPMQIFWAAPPQSNVKPEEYDGGLVAICAVKGDKTDVLEEGDQLRVGYEDTPGVKSYRISDIDEAHRQMGTSTGWGTTYLADDTSSYIGNITWFTLLNLARFWDDQGYNAQVRLELGLDYDNKNLLANYISVAKGRDERQQIRKLANTVGDWTVLHTVTPDAGEAVEGGEVDWADLEWQGEGHTIEYDEDYPRMPRIALDETNVVSGSITVTLKDVSRELDLTDYTTTQNAMFWQSWPVPPKYEVYCHRQQGDDWNETYLYFNPDLIGKEINVAYQYYLSDAALTHPTIFKGDLYFNETGPRHRWLKLSDGSFTNTYSPRFGDRGVSCVAVGSDRLLAVSEPSYIAVQFCKEWSGYIHEVRAEDVPLWQIVAGIARAGDQHCFVNLDKVFVANRTSHSGTGSFSNVLEIAKKDLRPYKRVILSYENGRVDQGEGKPELTLSCPYVFDKGHAEIICLNAYNYYTNKNRNYYIHVAGIFEQYGLLEEKSFSYQGVNTAGVITGREFRPEGTTVFDCHELELPGTMV